MLAWAGAREKEMIAKNEKVINFLGHLPFMTSVGVLTPKPSFPLEEFYSTGIFRVSCYMPLRPIHFEHEKFPVRVGGKMSWKGSLKVK